jgi:transcriptional regulator with XRE-family HTH domain
MLNIGSKITELRKQHNLSQAELAKQINVSRTIIGNYERNSNTPSIDVLLKMAKTFNVSVDFIIGEGQLSNYDNNILKRIDDIENLNEEDKKHLFALMDAFLRDAKTKKAYL